MSAQVRYYFEIKAYRLAFSLQQKIFVISRGWPREESHSLTCRILRAARAIGAGLSQAWAVRANSTEFVSRLTGVDAELAETLHWLETAKACGYLKPEQYAELRTAWASLGQLITAMARDSQRLPDELPSRPLKAVEGGPMRLL